MIPAQDQTSAGPELADVARYAALRAAIERRLREARREEEVARLSSDPTCTVQWWRGYVAALVNITKTDDASQEAPHNATAQTPPDSGTKNHG